MLVVLFVVSGLSAVIFDRSIMPYLMSKGSLSRFKAFQKMNERVTVINKTEQVTVKEDFSVTKTAQNILPSIVSIVTYEDVNSQEGAQLTIKSSQDIQKYVKTGLVITSDGLIMSVMDEGSEKTQPVQGKKYKILAADGREFDATLVAVDPYSNLVFYKAQASNLTAPMFSNSDELESGEKIVIAGNASGEYQNTFSMGIIKAKDKTFSMLNSELSSSEKREGAIITDAQIDSNNIGGPVIDFNGTVVGLANQVEKDGKKLGFIMPINSLKDSIDRVIRSGQVDRPQLGIYYLSINREISLLNNLPVSQGALVYSFIGQQGLAVIKNSSADLAGIKIGDIITEVQGEKITLDQPLSALIAKQNKSQEVKIKLLRNKEEQEFRVRLN